MAKRFQMVLLYIKGKILRKDNTLFLHELMQLFYTRYIYLSEF